MSSGRDPSVPIRVMTSGAFLTAFKELAPTFERQQNATIETIYAASMGDVPDTIPKRLKRGDVVDVVIMAASTLDELIAQKLVMARIDVVRSTIGIAVRAGAPRPDVSTVEALTRTLLQAKSIAYSLSASGVYLSKTLFPRLGIWREIAGKSRMIETEPVGAVVARGEVEIGFQQFSELGPVPGIDIVGPLPPGAQHVTFFSAGVVTASPRPELGRRLIEFLTSDAAAPVIRRCGLDPVGSG